MDDERYLQTQLGLTEDRVAAVEDEVKGAQEFYKNVEEMVYHLYTIKHLGELERFFAVYLVIQKDFQAKLSAHNDLHDAVIAELKVKFTAAERDLIMRRDDIAGLMQFGEERDAHIASLEKQLAAQKQNQVEICNACRKAAEDVADGKPIPP